MISAFVNRRPWVAALIGLIPGPFIGMLYLGKGRRGLVYLIVFLPMISLPPLAAHFGFLPLPAGQGVIIFAIAYQIVGAVDCYRQAKAAGEQRPGVWFARWYVLIGLYLFFGFLPDVLPWEPFHIPAGSMEPNLRVGDHLFISKYAYRISEPQRGDIVVFLLPSDNATAYVKRLVGLPGDRIQMKEGVLFLNDVAVIRQAVDSASAPGQTLGKVYRETLPNFRQYLIRERSDAGPQDNTEVYEVPPGHYFFLGDNRDNSMDSRVLDFMGYVPRENLIGPLSVIYWNDEAQRLRLFDAD